MSSETGKTYTEVTDRLNEIVAQVKSKDTSLEMSLDLFDEALALGERAVELVDHSEFSPEELDRAQNDQSQDDNDAPATAPEGSDQTKSDEQEVKANASE